MLRLNLGCGREKLNGCINIDVNPDLGPDLVCNFIEGLPYSNEEVDTVYLFHTIEHIPKILHSKALGEVARVLKVYGVLYVSYPEFEVCCRNWLENKSGKREFWEATIYGRQSSPHDYHVCAMHTPYFINFLQSLGFECQAKQEIEPFNTIVKATKVRGPVSIESIYKKEWYGIDSITNAATNPS